MHLEVVRCPPCVPGYGIPLNGERFSGGHGHGLAMAVEIAKRPVASKELQDWLRDVFIVQQGRGYRWCLA